MVKTNDGSIPRYYVDNLSKEFYLRPAREVRAVFSTNNGALPARTLSPTADMATGRHVYLWCAEDIQNHANSVRKKHWNLMKSMPQPTCWEDLYDYFDCVDLFHHGALNLWNLVCHLVHENKMLRDNLIHGISFEVGMWCDEWLARNHNKTRLRDFSDWGNVLVLFDGSELEEIRQLDPFSQDILRTALAHRQHQLAGQLGLHPPVYPGNTAAAQLHQSNMQNWLGK
ncbi:hypothetical protein CMUS01_03692 [Colletotrichum musicola]|uniref:Uncharacterized protein n=1 Tax=Colletotrichum musicola TaxID=2175873 RepID=A0A8H6NR66_9PEZI|nr:hypothetical protein CMUS01_03692 [Colletotrichum musicola]